MSSMLLRLFGIDHIFWCTLLHRVAFLSLHSPLWTSFRTCRALAFDKHYNHCPRYDLLYNFPFSKAYLAAFRAIFLACNRSKGRSSSLMNLTKWVIQHLGSSTSMAKISVLLKLILGSSNFSRVIHRCSVTSTEEARLAKASALLFLRGECNSNWWSWCPDSCE